MASVFFYCQTLPQNSPLSTSSRFPNTLYRLRRLRHEGLSLTLSFSLIVFHFSSLRFNNPLCIFFGIAVISQHPDPIGSGLGDEAIVEAAGPDCLVPGQKMPLQLLGLQVLFFLFFCLIDGFLPDFQSLLL